jgi:hypothetical protein
VTQREVTQEDSLVTRDAQREGTQEGGLKRFADAGDAWRATARPTRRACANQAYLHQEGE